MYNVRTQTFQLFSNVKFRTRNWIGITEFLGWRNQNTCASYVEQNSLDFQPFSSSVSAMKCASLADPIFDCALFVDGPKSPFVSVTGETVEGSSVTLSCNSDANPKANYTWHRKSHDWTQVAGQNFTITDIREEDSGYYYCEAWNSIGRIKSDSHLITVAGPTRLICLLFICVWQNKHYLTLMIYQLPLLAL